MFGALGLAALAAVFALTAPVRQDPGYHQFANTATIWGIPNFWNVVSNLALLAAAAYGASLLSRGRIRGHGLVVIAVAAVAAGSAYYHWQPGDARLVWDRLPMTVVFMALVGRFFSLQWVRVALLAVGVASVLVWVAFDDLRLYGLVQFGAMIAMALLGGKPYAWVGVWYVGAKLLEHFDVAIATVVPMGGHALKHVAAALAMVAYFRAERRLLNANS